MLWCGPIDAMPRDGAIIFSDLVGKLGALRIECPKCGRSGRYMLARLIARYGRQEKLFTWMDEITADCPRKQARSDSDPRRYLPRSAEGAMTGVE
jgi:hypothetical protein